MKMLYLISKLEIGISIIPFLILILLTGNYKLFFTYFLITFIHELGHIIMASLFKVKVEKIKLNIFGFSGQIDDYTYLDSYKQILILLAGPLTYFISKILINQFYLHDIISLVTYHKALLTNKYILLFNILPIYPLDGGRLLKLFLDKIFTFKFSKILSISISFVFILLFVIYTRGHKQYLMYLFTIMNLLVNVLFIEKEWKEFLFKRLYFINKYKEKVHNKKDLYIYKNNYVIYDKKILSEKSVIKKFLNH